MKRQPTIKLPKDNFNKMVLFTSLVVFLFVFPINNYIYFYYSFFSTHARCFIQPKSVVRACLDFGFLEEWILFGLLFSKLLRHGRIATTPAQRLHSCVVGEAMVEGLGTRRSHDAVKALPVEVA